MQKYNLFTNRTFAHTAREREKDDPHLSMSVHFEYICKWCVDIAKKETVCVSSSQNVLLHGGAAIR